MFAPASGGVQVRLKGLLNDRGRFQPGILCLHSAPATLSAQRGAARPPMHRNYVLKGKQGVKKHTQELEFKSFFMT